MGTTARTCLIPGRPPARSARDVDPLGRDAQTSNLGTVADG